MNDCWNVDFNAKGKIAVVVGGGNQFMVLEIGKNLTNPEQMIIIR
jgi:hypothetical protein